MKIMKGLLQHWKSRPQNDTSAASTNHVGNQMQSKHQSMHGIIIYLIL